MAKHFLLDICGGRVWCPCGEVFRVNIQTLTVQSQQATSLAISTCDRVNALIKGQSFAIPITKASHSFSITTPTTLEMTLAVT